MKKNIIYVGVIILIILGSVYFFIRSSNLQKNSLDGGITSSENAGTLQYKNIERGFTLEYPKELTYKDFDEGDTTHTIVFEDKDGEKGFQIFFTPYYGTQITQSRILKDISGGTFTEPVDIIINGSIHALAFFSASDAGELREIWFIQDGYLYEVTAYKQLDEWLAGIMKTWSFYQVSPAGGV